MPEKRERIKMKKRKATVAAQIGLIVIALVLTIIGIIRSSDDPARWIVYIGQAVTCISIIVFGLRHIDQTDFKYFKIVINCYALFEALRAALLNTSGVAFLPAFLSRFILACLACCCVLFAERIETKDCLKFGYGLIGMEILLYIVFIIGFPGMMYGHLKRFMPLAGVLIAASIVLFRTVREKQPDEGAI